MVQFSQFSISDVNNLPNNIAVAPNLDAFQEFFLPNWLSKNGGIPQEGAELNKREKNHFMTKKKTKCNLKPKTLFWKTNRLNFLSIQFEAPVLITANDLCYYNQSKYY